MILLGECDLSCPRSIQIMPLGTLLPRYICNQPCTLDLAFYCFWLASFSKALTACIDTILKPVNLEMWCPKHFGAVQLTREHFREFSTVLVLYTWMCVHVCMTKRNKSFSLRVLPPVAFLMSFFSSHYRPHKWILNWRRGINFWSCFLPLDVCDELARWD